MLAGRAWVPTHRDWDGSTNVNVDGEELVGALVLLGWDATHVFEVGEPR